MVPSPPHPFLAIRSTPTPITPAIHTSCRSPLLLSRHTPSRRTTSRLAVFRRYIFKLRIKPRRRQRPPTTLGKAHPQRQRGQRTMQTHAMTLPPCVRPRRLLRRKTPFPPTPQPRHIHISRLECTWCVCGSSHVADPPFLTQVDSRRFIHKQTCASLRCRCPSFTHLPNPAHSRRLLPNVNALCDPPSFTTLRVPLCSSYLDLFVSRLIVYLVRVVLYCPRVPLLPLELLSFAGVSCRVSLDPPASFSPSRLPLLPPFLSVSPWRSRR